MKWMGWGEIVEGSYFGGLEKRLSERNLMALFFCADASAADCGGLADAFEDVIMSAAVLKSIEENE